MENTIPFQLDETPDQDSLLFASIILRDVYHTVTGSLIELTAAE